MPNEHSTSSMTPLVMMIKFIRLSKNSDAPSSKISFGDLGKMHGWFRFLKTNHMHEK
jgi:hypothetical protein